MPLVHVPPYLADLEFTIDAPPGFADPGTPREDVDFGNPVLCAPLVLLASPVAAAIITVSARPAYETGSVLQWTRYLTEFYGIDLNGWRAGVIGTAGLHPAILAEGVQHEEVNVRIAIAAFEDGGRFILATAICPQELWTSLGEPMTRALHSITLARPRGPAHDLDSTTALGWRKEDIPTAEQMEAARVERAEARRPLLARAEALIAAGEFDEAEALVRGADCSIEAVVALARAYEARLRECVAENPDSVALDALFRRALAAAQNCYPDPHTEMEADDYAAAREADAARLAAIMSPCAG